MLLIVLGSSSFNMKTEHIACHKLLYIESFIETGQKHLFLSFFVIIVVVALSCINRVLLIV